MFCPLVFTLEYESERFIVIATKFPFANVSNEWQEMLNVRQARAERLRQGERVMQYLIGYRSCRAGLTLLPTTRLAHWHTGTLVKVGVSWPGQATTGRIFTAQHRPTRLAGARRENSYRENVKF